MEKENNFDNDLTMNDDQDPYTDIVDQSSNNTDLVVQEEKDDPIFDVTDDFDEVLELTEFNDQTKINTQFSVADYTKVRIPEIAKLTKRKANAFVSKVTKFVLEFNDRELTTTHKDYIKTVAKLELDNLESLLMLIEINKTMIQNITERINLSMGEDYTAIISYNNLVNQHLKLIKENQNMYRSIPSSMKKMRSEVLTNQELRNENYQGNNEVIGEHYGELQFNSGKQFLKSLIEDKEKQKMVENTKLLSLEEEKTEELHDTQLSEEDMQLKNSNNAEN
jgi:hypothetical protein